MLFTIENLDKDVFNEELNNRKTHRYKLGQKVLVDFNDLDINPGDDEFEELKDMYIVFQSYDCDKTPLYGFSETNTIHLEYDKDNEVLPIKILNARCGYDKNAIKKVYNIDSIPDPNIFLVLSTAVMQIVDCVISLSKLKEKVKWNEEKEKYEIEIIGDEALIMLR